MRSSTDRRRAVLARLLAAVTAGALCLLGAPASATAFSASARVLARHKGRPTVVLDHLDFPSVPNGAQYERHLRATLKREVRRADWGAGSGHRIEYRYFVTELSFSQTGGVLTVECAAVGRLPKGKIAKSRLRYGGDAKTPKDVTFRVLDIVARGVITRLSELERARRQQAG